MSRQKMSRCPESQFWVIFHSKPCTAGTPSQRYLKFRLRAASLARNGAPKCDLVEAVCVLLPVFKICLEQPRISISIDARERCRYSSRGYKNDRWPFLYYCRYRYYINSDNSRPGSQDEKVMWSKFENPACTFFVRLKKCHTIDTAVDTVRPKLLKVPFIKAEQVRYRYCPTKSIYPCSCIDVDIYYQKAFVYYRYRDIDTHLITHNCKKHTIDIRYR